MYPNLRSNDIKNYNINMPNANPQNLVYNFQGNMPNNYNIPIIQKSPMSGFGMEGVNPSNFSNNI